MHGQLLRVLGEESLAASSPKLQPALDFHSLSVCEVGVNKQPHSTEDSLRERIAEVMIDLYWYMLKRACDMFRSQMERLIDVEDDFYE